MRKRDCEREREREISYLFLPCLQGYPHKSLPALQDDLIVARFTLEALPGPAHHQTEYSASRTMSQDMGHALLWSWKSTCEQYEAKSMNLHRLWECMARGTWSWQLDIFLIFRHVINLMYLFEKIHQILKVRVSMKQAPALQCYCYVNYVILYV